MDAKLARQLEAKCRPDTAADLAVSKRCAGRTTTFAFRYFDNDTNSWKMHRSVEVEYFDTSQTGPATDRGKRHRLFEPGYL